MKSNILKGTGYKSELQQATALIEQLYSKTYIELIVEK